MPGGHAENRRQKVTGIEVPLGERIRELVPFTLTGFDDAAREALA